MPKVKNHPYPKDKPHMKGLSMKQQKWVEVTAETGEPAKAAVIAYPTQKVPKQMAVDNLARPYLREAILMEMEHQGITDALLTTKLKDGLDASKIHTSHTEPDKVIPDHPTRLRYVQECNKLRDAYPDKQINVSKQVANINLYGTLSDEQLEARKLQLQEDIKQIQGG